MVRIRPGAPTRDVEYRASGGGGEGGGVGGILGQMQTGATAGSATEGEVAERNEFLEVVFLDVQNYWEATLPDYRRATMVIFNDRVVTGGDFAQAYVVAHEVAHHVQTVTGVSEQVRAPQSRAGSREEANAWTIRLELQADCLAGSWASVASRRQQTFEGNDNLLHLDAGDIVEGLQAAEVVGDDRIQETAGQQVQPHIWTHGSAASGSGPLRSAF